MLDRLPPLDPGTLLPTLDRGSPLLYWFVHTVPRFERPCFILLSFSCASHKVLVFHRDIVLQVMQ
jgi:hypothetical protein